MIVSSSTLHTPTPTKKKPSLQPPPEFPAPAPPPPATCPSLPIVVPTGIRCRAGMAAPLPYPRRADLGHFWAPQIFRNSDFQILTPHPQLYDARFQFGKNLRNRMFLIVFYYGARIIMKIRFGIGSENRIRTYTERKNSYKSSDYCILINELPALLIRRSLVRVQVGEPGKSSLAVMQGFFSFPGKFIMGSV